MDKIIYKHCQAGEGEGPGQGSGDGVSRIAGLVPTTEMAVFCYGFAGALSALRSPCQGFLYGIS
jgi:hypothetical protein